MAEVQIRGRARRRNRTQRAEMIERFHGSGLAAADFAARERLSLQTLKRWLAEAKRTGQSKPAVAFSELALPPLLGPSSPWAVEVVSARGVTIRCREALPIPALLRLLRS